MIWPDFNFERHAAVVFSNFVFDAFNPTGALQASAKDAFHNFTACCTGSICETDGYQDANDNNQIIKIAAVVRC